MRIDWAGPAVSDLRCIREYIARDSAYYADRFVERVIAAVGDLVAFPQMGRMVPEAHNPHIRELLFNNYRIMYRLETERILVIAVAHAARDWNRQAPRPWDVV